MISKKIREKYGENWEFIARDIKEKADWKCRKCGRTRDVKKNVKLTVHHIDGNCKNNTESNLICLCSKCHLEAQQILQAQYEYKQKEERGQTSLIKNPQLSLPTTDIYKV